MSLKKWELEAAEFFAERTVYILQQTVQKLSGAQQGSSLHKDVILDVLGRLIATPHRSAVSEPLPVLVFCFGDWQVLAQDVHGRETVMRLIQSVGDAEKEFEKAFHFLEVAEVMKSGQDIVSVTQPTVTVVPVSSSSE